MIDNIPIYMYFRSISKNICCILPITYLMLSVNLIFQSIESRKFLILRCRLPRFTISPFLSRAVYCASANAVLPPFPGNSANKTSAILFLASIVSFLLRKIVCVLFDLYASAYTHLRIIRYYLSRVMNVMMVKDAVAQRFRELCIQRGIRINELANLSGVTPSTVYSMLDPKRREISITTIKKLCDGLDISLSDFFTAPIFDQLEQEIK